LPYRRAALCVITLPATLLAQSIDVDSVVQRWTLRSGPVTYRLAQVGRHVALDYFGPTARESDTTRVPSTYPRLRPIELVGTIGGLRIDSASLQFVSARATRRAAGDELTLRLRHATLPVTFEERYAAWGETGVITRDITVRNTGARTIAVDVTPAWYHPKGNYTLRYLQGTWGQERQLETETLGAGVRTFEQTSGRSSKGYVPWISLRNERARVEYLAELAWSGNWRAQIEKYPGENDVMLRDRPIAVRMGFRPDGGSPLLLASGQSFALPRLALTASAGDLDDVANQMHRYQRAYVSPPAPGNRPLLVQFNTWYPFGQDVDITKAKQAADAAAAIGAEVYIVDSGWYVDKDWVLELGDYQVSARKFPHGLEELSRYVRERGMKFGLWVEIENVGQRSRMFREHPDWCLPYRGAPVINDRRCQLDFARPAVRQWARGVVERLITTYQLGWIKIDYNIDVGDRFDASRTDRTGARLYDHVMAYYTWLDEVRAAHPQLVVENCSSGALRFDSGIIAHTHSTWVSDVVAAKQSLQLAYGCTLQFSPELCNHWMVGDRDDGTVDPNAAAGWWDFMFRVPMTGQFGISSRAHEWSDALRQRAIENVRLYKRIRGTLTGADVYHLTDAPDHNDPRGWMAMQYVHLDGRSVLMAYRLREGRRTETFRLRGLPPDARYNILKDGQPWLSATGLELARGLAVTLEDEWRAVVVELVPSP
jgi:alpha-galactosidase